MQRIFAFALMTLSAAAGAAAFLIVSVGTAASQVVDPGWQLVYAGQPGYAGDGLIDSMFGDGTGQPVVARAYQPAAVYYQPAAAAQQPSANAHIDAQQPPAPASEPQAAAQKRASPSAPVRLQPPMRQQARTAPASGARVPVPPSSPQYTGSIPGQQVRGLFSAPANYPPAAPQQGAYRSANQAVQPVPQQRLAFGYETQQQQYGYQPQQPNYGYQQQGGYAYQPQQPTYTYQPQQRPDYPPAYAPSSYGDMAQQPVDPRYERQLVDYQGNERPGTIIIDTPHFFLYLVLGDGKALRYGIGVGRPGFTWAGIKAISAKREWPDWHPPDEMLARRPDLPRYMPGGPDNPLGARALYLGSTLYRIHGSNEPWSIGTQVSSGCIRLRNEDIIDLYGRVKVGAKVVVI